MKLNMIKIIIKDPTQTDDRESVFIDIRSIGCEWSNKGSESKK